MIHLDTQRKKCKLNIQQQQKTVKLLSEKKRAVKSAKKKKKAENLLSFIVNQIDKLLAIKL